MALCTDKAHAKQWWFAMPVIRRGATGRGVAALLTGLLLTARPSGAQAPGTADSVDITAPARCGACLAGPALGLSPLDPTAMQQPRPRAIEYSEGYGTRLEIHKIGSFASLPLFAAEYFVGEHLLNQEIADPYARHLALRGPHSAIAGALGVVFAVNTVTGVWNLVDSRHDPYGRTRRWVHSIAMLVADGGMVATAISAGSARHDIHAAQRHRALAIGTFSLTTVASLMMWVWKT